MEAVEVAVAVARDHGVRVDDPVVLRDAWHVLVHLRPAPVVARVSSTAPGVDASQVERELGVASHAAARGAPVIPPSDELDPGPHRRDGRVVTFWRFVESVGERDAAVAGRRLRDVHEALVDYAGELPLGHGAEILEVLDAAEPSADVEFLRELASRELPLGQAVHGDAHVGNCLQSADGPLWHDFETACRGPREFDLAPLVMGHLQGKDARAETALRAYGPCDEGALEASVLVYASWICASYLVALPRRPELEDSLRARIAWLRSFA